jgi:hypothetical protein
MNGSDHAILWESEIYTLRRGFRAGQYSLVEHGRMATLGGIVKKRLLARLTNPNDTAGQLENFATHPVGRWPYF